MPRSAPGFYPALVPSGWEDGSRAGLRRDEEVQRSRAPRTETRQHRDRVRTGLPQRRPDCL